MNVVQPTLPPLAGQPFTATPAHDFTSDHTKALFRRREISKAGFIALGIATGLALALTNAQWFLAALVLLASVWGVAWVIYSRIDRSAWASYGADRQASLGNIERHVEGAVDA